MQGVAQIVAHGRHLLHLLIAPLELAQRLIALAANVDGASQQPLAVRRHTDEEQPVYGGEGDRHRRFVRMRHTPGRGGIDQHQGGVGGQHALGGHCDGDTRAGNGIQRRLQECLREQRNVRQEQHGRRAGREPRGPVQRDKHLMETLRRVGREARQRPPRRRGAGALDSEGNRRPGEEYGPCDVGQNDPTDRTDQRQLEYRHAQQNARVQRQQLVTQLRALSAIGARALAHLRAGAAGWP